MKPACRAAPALLCCTLACVAAPPPAPQPTQDAGANAAPMDAGTPDGAPAQDASTTASSSGDAGNTALCPGTVEGCTPRGSPGDFSCQLNVDGRDRSYDLHIPSSWAQRPATGVPVVFNFHGVNTTAALQRYFSGMDAVGEARGFVVVTPEGVQMSWNAGVCCGGATTSGVDDVGFTLSILERLSNSLCVDPRRVFATGLSNGGHMSYRLACEASLVFAAVAPVAGVEALFPCNPQRPVPVLHFHGDADSVVSYQSGIQGYGAQDVVERWAQRNGCGSPWSVVLQQGEVTCRGFPDCDANADVQLCTISGGGHQWPGGQSIPLLGHNTNDINASEAILTFFAAHPMP